MAKIIYAVEKEGMGHAIRGKVIIEKLLKKHKLKIIAGGKPFNYLSKYFKNVHKIDNFNLVYTNNSVNILLTLLSNFIKTPLIFLYNLKLIKLILNFKPDVIITDFEPFSSYISHLFRIPLISIDNQHLMTKCKINIPEKYRKDYLIAYSVINLMVDKADKYFITTFFYPKVKEKNVLLFPPIIREKILKAKTKKGNHILVYQTSKTYKQLVKILKKINQKFIVCGFDKSYIDKNLIFKKFNENTFFKDLTESKAVITNGGFTLISEAIYLRKPILAIPIKKQFEQILNALYVKKLGYGEYYLGITKNKVENFIKNLPKFRENLRKIKKHDNSKILNKLEYIISKSTKDSLR